MTDDDRTRREGPLPRRPTAEPTRLEGENATVAAAYLSRGTLVGRYVVLDVLGEGGMGVVYAAFDPELDRRSEAAARPCARDRQASAGLR